MKKIKDLFFTFSCIVTGSSVAAAIFMTIFFNGEYITNNILWQILGISAVCCLGDLFYPDGKLSKKQTYTLNLLNYIYVNVIVIGGGILFDWFDPSQLIMVLSMVILIAITFIIIIYISYTRSKRDTYKMNERLQEYQKKRDPS